VKVIPRVLHHWRFLFLLFYLVPIAGSQREHVLTVDLYVVHQHAEGGCLVKHLCCLPEKWINQEFQIVLKWDCLVINPLFHALLIQEFLANLKVTLRVNAIHLGSKSE
jgi:hypothetical protein